MSKIEVTPQNIKDVILTVSEAKWVNKDESKLLGLVNASIEASIPYLDDTTVKIISTILDANNIGVCQDHIRYPFALGYMYTLMKNVGSSVGVDFYRGSTVILTITDTVGHAFDVCRGFLAEKKRRNDFYFVEQGCWPEVEKAVKNIVFETAMDASINAWLMEAAAAADEYYDEFDGDMELDQYEELEELDLSW